MTDLHWTLDDPCLSAEALLEANSRHDREHGPLREFASKRCRTCNIGNNIIGKNLTDKKISEYENRGFYSLEFKAARKEMMAKRQARKRVGNFDVVDGRMVYRPV